MIKKLLFIIAGFVLLLLLSPLLVKLNVRGKIFGNINNVPKREFAIVLGAGLNNDGTPGFYLKNRLEDAVQLYRHNKISKFLLTGDNGNSGYDEISAMNNFLLQNGVPQNSIFGDYAGFDTYSSMERADKIFGIKSAVVVSQGFHLPRSVFMLSYKGADAVGFSSKSSLGRRKYFVREWFATIKSLFDCVRNRKSKFYGKKVDTRGNSNIEIKQL